MHVVTCITLDKDWSNIKKVINVEKNGDKFGALREISMFEIEIRTLTAPDASVVRIVGSDSSLFFGNDK